MPAPPWCRSTSRCCRTCIARSTQIKKLGAKAGVVLNPSTPVVAIEDVAADVDFVLVMSVNPGLRRPGVHPAQRREDSRACARCSIAPATAAPIEVDGGIDLTTVDAASSTPAPNGWSPATRSSAAATPKRRRARSRTRPRGRAGMSVDSVTAAPARAGRVRRDDLDGARALRRNRQDGRGLLRELSGLVRGRPHRLAARDRLDLSRRWKTTASSCRSSKRTANTGRARATTTTSRSGRGRGSCRRCGSQFDYEVDPARRRRRCWRRATPCTPPSIATGRPVRLPDRVKDLFA